jgi:hypothetical protein
LGRSQARKKSGGRVLERMAICPRHGQQVHPVSERNNAIAFPNSPSNLPFMKAASLASLLLVLQASLGFGQGKITFGNNLPTLQAPIFGPELDGINSGGDWANAKTGNTPTNIPAGSQIYGGALLESMIVSFWAAPGVVTDGHLLAQGNVITTLGTGSLAGYFPTTSVLFAGLPANSLATVQVRVTDPSGTWLFGDNQFAAVSSLFTVDVGGVFPVTATGLRSFSVGWLDNSTLTPYVPEPSTPALLLTGTAVIFWCGRIRKP